MMVGSSPKISCMGIIGDGCGAGREFIVENKTLVAYDPYTQERLVLLEDIEDAKSISKNGCMLSITCKDKEIRFDLSALKKV